MRNSTPSAARSAVSSATACSPDSVPSQAPPAFAAAKRRRDQSALKRSNAAVASGPAVSATRKAGSRA